MLVGVNDATCYNCNRRNPGLWGYAPWLRRLGQDLGFVPLVMGGTITLYVISLLLSGANLQTMLAPSTQVLFLVGSSGAVPVFGYGRWWTVLTAGWLHAGVLHILFNVMWIRQLGPAVADLYGPGRMVMLYTLAGVVGFTFTSVAGRYLGGLPIIGGGEVLGRRLGADLRPARRAGLLRPAHRLTPHRPGRPAVRALHGHSSAWSCPASTTRPTSGASSAATSGGCCSTRSSRSGSTTWWPRPLPCGDARRHHLVRGDGVAAPHADRRRPDS